MFDYDDFISRIDTALVDARYWSRNAEIYYTAAKFEHDNDNDHAAQFEMLGMLFSLQHSVDKLAPYKNLLYGLWNLERFAGGVRDDFTELCGGSEYELTMDTIINVMLSASNEEYKAFIGLVDAYRMALWNQPFEAEYYSALARGFTL